MKGTRNKVAVPSNIDNPVDFKANRDFLNGKDLVSPEDSNRSYNNNIQRKGTFLGMNGISDTSS